MATYAQISSGTVVNVIIADSGDYFDPAFTWVDVTSTTPQPQINWTYDGMTFTPPGLAVTAYGQQVTMTTDGVTDTYHVDGVNYPFSHGTLQAVAYLAITISVNLHRFQAALQSFVSARYSTDIRLNMHAIHTLAVNNSLTNRAAYIEQLFTWAQSIVTYATTYMGTVNALTNPTTVASTTWDFSSLASSDPLVTPQGALAISN